MKIVLFDCKKWSMNKEQIIIQNAHTNNLRNVSIAIPKHKLVVFTGVSGSGKSSLLFDTIYVEAQRQLIGTFSTFARTRMPKLSRPDVDDILNLSTAIVIDQKRMGNNLRSTVGTATEINTYLRLLYSRIGKPFIGPSFMFSFNHPEGMCPHCGGLGKKVQVDIDLLIDKEKSIYEGAVLYPGMQAGSWFWREMTALEIFDVHKKLKDFTEEELNKFLYTEPIPVSKAHGAAVYSKNFEGIARRLERSVSEKAEDELPHEQKDAYRKFLVYNECNECSGARLNPRARQVTINGISIDKLCSMELPEVLGFISEINDEISVPVLRKAQFLLQKMIEIGIGYLTLDRAVSTLSGGESQRVKMARQLDCNLVDLLYVLDEPSIGLHPRDTDNLLTILFNLKEKGNSVFIVEHDPEIIRSAEWIIDIGPKAGKDGGNVVYSGEPNGIKPTGSVTGKYLFQNDKVKLKNKEFVDFYYVENANIHNLKNVSVKIPKGALTCITGVAGSGKSSLIHGCFAKQHPEAINIDQSDIGKTSRANPATYTGVFDLIRKEFASETGAEASLFSFNSKGACPKCNGQGVVSMELHFLDAVKTHCDECDGKRYNPQALQYKYKNMNIADVLDLTVNQALEFFTTTRIKKHLKVLQDVGLGYLKIGQPLSTLSGGEAQRLKIATELHNESNIYIMDEPTTGLHMSDIDNFYRIVKSLVNNRNTVVIIEHNLDIIKHADWIIDMGPEGGKNGGELIFEGTPADLIHCERSYTGKYLKRIVEIK
jgi:excinuclease UvrABC ATPase subunit